MGLEQVAVQCSVGLMVMQPKEPVAEAAVAGLEGAVIAEGVRDLVGETEDSMLVKDCSKCSHSAQSAVDCLGGVDRED